MVNLIKLRDHPGNNDPSSRIVRSSVYDSPRWTVYRTSQGHVAAITIVTPDGVATAAVDGFIEDEEEAVAAAKAGSQQFSYRGEPTSEASPLRPIRFDHSRDRTGVWSGPEDYL